MRESQYFPLPDSKDPFDKVIFLDIDGVVNDGHHDATKPIIDSKMVSYLAYIVCETNARIVLSSSWKHAWRQFVANGYVPTSHYDSDLVALKESLDDYDLVIDGFTPDSDPGPDSRPHEIRAWLLSHPNVLSFVILDDDDFWTFGWLNRYFVCTQTETGEIRWPGHLEMRRGLSLEHAKQAIAILNDGCPPLSRSEEQVASDEIYLKRLNEQQSDYIST